MQDQVILQTCPVCLKGPVVQREEPTTLGLRKRRWWACRACGSVLVSVRGKCRYDVISKRYPHMIYLKEHVFCSLDDVGQVAIDRIEELARQKRTAAAKQAEQDAMLTEARAIVSREQRATPFQLQAGLKVGYAAAARLLDQLGDQGVVGPYQTAREWREVLIHSAPESAAAADEERKKPIAEGPSIPSSVSREQAGDFNEQVQRNLRAIDLERLGRVDEAIELYEENVREGFRGNQPYDRLASIYRERGLIDEEIRVLQRAVWVLENLADIGVLDRATRRQAYQRKLAEAWGIDEWPSCSPPPAQVSHGPYDGRHSRNRGYVLTKPEYSRDAYILKWWTPSHDELLATLIQEQQWDWADRIPHHIIEMTPEHVIETWKAGDPQCATHGWYNPLHDFAVSRAQRLGLTKAIRRPERKLCPLCGCWFVEDSLPHALIQRLGIDRLDFCAPCLKTTVLQQTGNDSLPRQDVLAYLRALTDVLQRVPSQGFGEGVSDLRDLSTQERVALLKLLQRKPSVRRVKDLFGSWFEALIEAGILEHDARRLSRGTQCLAKDGHICFSLGEKTIDDALHALGIPHEKEVRYPEGGFRADFGVNEVLIEYFGLTGDADYDAKTRAKHDICVAHRIKLISIYPNDLVAPEKLRSILVKGVRLRE